MEQKQKIRLEAYTEILHKYLERLKYYPVESAAFLTMQDVQEIISYHEQGDSEPFAPR